jgi:aminoglycoside 6'-N-acetyltransferase I
VRKELEADRTGRIDLVATDSQGRVIGWIGGTSQYDGRVWELHPLAVAPASQGRGVGSALVFALEQRVRERGGLTIWLGSDDEDTMTTVSGIDLFPAPLEHLQRIRNLRRHPYEFYERLGYALIGVMPDANGPGKPDIFLAKSLAR